METETLVCKFQTINYDGYCCVTWTQVVKDPTILSIQEPISETYIDKNDFHNAYHKFLNTLDGRDMTSFADFYWQRSTVNNSCLEFVDQDCRLDLYDFLREEDLIPDMELVHSGAWKFKNSKKKDKNKKEKNKRELVF